MERQDKMSSGDPEATVTDTSITTVETVVTTQDDNMIDPDHEVYTSVVS